MYAIPNLEAGRVSRLNDDVEICNLPRNNIQIGSVADPCLVVRLSPPFGRTIVEIGNDDDMTVTIDLCDARQINFFETLDSELDKQCVHAFGDELPFKSIIRDGLVKFKIKKTTCFSDKNKSKLPVTDIGQQDKCIFIIRVSCLWKSATNVGASMRIVRGMLIERGIVDAVPDFDLS